MSTTPTIELENVFEDLDRPSMAALIEMIADVSLVVDAEGRIVESSVGSEELKSEFDPRWTGRAWADTVTEESRGKVDELLALAGEDAGGPLWRDVNHLLADGSELPIRYCAVSFPGSGRLIALGRDLRAVAALRQQLLNAQLALEQDYWKLRQVETRYRMLFQMAADAVMVLDEASGRVLEANPAASQLLLHDRDASIVGKVFPIGLDEAGTKAANALLAEARSAGRSSQASVRSASGEQEFAVVANLLRQDRETRLLVRLSASPVAGTTSADTAVRLPEMMQRAPDAILLTAFDGRILAANQTFADLAQLAGPEQAVGQSVDRWLGRVGVDLGVLLGNLRRHDAVKLFATTLRGEYGASGEVEISANRYEAHDPPVFVFYIRDVARRIGTENPAGGKLPRSVAQITQQVGRVPLKGLVRQSTDVIEKLCIEAALELTGDNRASAADLLGLSRQSLYAKMRRYKLGELGGDED